MAAPQGLSQAWAGYGTRRQRDAGTQSGKGVFSWAGNRDPERETAFGAQWEEGLVEYFVLTNNPLVRERLAHEAEVAFVSGGIGDVFERAARYVADGHRMLTHPLSGSVKPGWPPME